MSSRIIRSFVIPGAPVPHPRATGGEFRKGTNRTKAYLAYKDTVGWSYKAHYGGADLYRGPVAISIVIQHPEPWNRDQRRFDGVNILKAIEDGLTGVAYEDDWWIWRQRITLEHGAEPCVIVTLEGRATAESETA